MFNKNDKIQLHITDISTSGDGIGKSEGFPFFVKNAVIGDTVEAVITKVKKSYGFAKVTRILSPSPWRVEPVCPQAERCGGCQIMQLSYEKQLEFKEQLVRNNLTRIGGVAFDENTAFLPILGMSEPAQELPQQFRNKVQFPVGQNKDGRIIAGFYAGRTHYIIETDSCPVSCAVNDRLLQTICSFLTKQNIPAYDEASGTGMVRHILLRNGFRTGQIMVCLVINGRSLKEGSDADALFAETLLEQFAKAKQEAPAAFSCRLPDGHVTEWRIAGISLNVNQRKTNVILGEEILSLYGKTYIEDIISLQNHDSISVKTNNPSFSGSEDRMLPAAEKRLSQDAELLKDLTFHISPLSFYQVNPMQTEKLYAKALEFAQLTGKETVWDLYCGIGTISLFLAQRAKKVCGVEIVPDAIRDARANAALNGMDNLTFYCGDSAEVFIEHIFGNEEAADVVVLDPPRKGCDARLLEAVKTVGPARIVYVSCDSATLARDLKILMMKEDGRSAYQVEKVQPVDMFPHTVHVETVVSLFQPPKKRDSIRIDVDVSEMEATITETQHLTTYDEIKKYCQEVHGVKVSTLFISQVKHFHGLEMRRNYNTSKNSAYKRPKCPEDKFHAIEDALRHFKMI